MISTSVNKNLPRNSHKTAKSPKGQDLILTKSYVHEHKFSGPFKVNAHSGLLVTISTELKWGTFNENVSQNFVRRLCLQILIRCMVVFMILPHVATQQSSIGLMINKFKYGSFIDLPH